MSIDMNPYDSSMTDPHLLNHETAAKIARDVVFPPHKNRSIRVKVKVEDDEDEGGGFGSSSLRSIVSSTCGSKSQYAQPQPQPPLRKVNRTTTSILVLWKRFAQLFIGCWNQGGQSSSSSLSSVTKKRAFACPATTKCTAAAGKSSPSKLYKTKKKSSIDVDSLLFVPTTLAGAGAVSIATALPRSITSSTAPYDEKCHLSTSTPKLIGVIAATVKKSTNSKLLLTPPHLMEDWSDGDDELGPGKEDKEEAVDDEDDNTIELHEKMTQQGDQQGERFNDSDRIFRDYFSISGGSEPGVSTTDVRRFAKATGSSRMSWDVDHEESYWIHHAPDAHKSNSTTTSPRSTKTVDKVEKTEPSPVVVEEKHEEEEKNEEPKEGLATMPMSQPRVIYQTSVESVISNNSTISIECTIIEDQLMPATSTELSYCNSISDCLSFPSSQSLELQFNQREITVSPGVQLPIRGAKETMSTLRKPNKVVTTKCWSCETPLCCLHDAAYILCPKCRVIAPLHMMDGVVIDTDDSDAEQQDYSNSNPKCRSNQKKRHGVALGFTDEEWLQWSQQLSLYEA